MAFDVVITIGRDALERAVLRVLDPVLSGLPGAYPLTSPGATGSALAIDKVRPSLGASGSDLWLDLSVDGRLLGDLLVPLPTPVNVATVDLPLGHFLTVPLGSGSPTGSSGLGISFQARVPLTIGGPSPDTLQELWLTPHDPNLAAPVPLDTAAMRSFLSGAEAALRPALSTVVHNRPFADLPDSALQSAGDEIQRQAEAQVRILLTDLPAVSLGRIVGPGGGNSCATRLIPTGASARVVTGGGSFFLQIGLMQQGASPAGQAFPDPSGRQGALDLTVSNVALVRLLCCVVETMPNLACPTDGEITETEPTTPCCRHQGVTRNLGPVAFTGLTLELCVFQPAEGPAKQIRLRCHGEHPTTAVNVQLDVQAELRLDLTLSAELLSGVISDLRAEVRVQQTALLTAAILAIPFIGIPVEAIAMLLIIFADAQLSAMLKTAFQPLKSIPTIPLIPPGLLDVIGEFTSQAVTIDDLVASGTSWARPGLRQLQRPVELRGSKWVTKPQFRPPDWSQLAPQPDEETPG